MSGKGWREMNGEQVYVVRDENYEAGYDDGVESETERIIELLENLDPFGSIDTAFVPDLIQLINGETNG